MPYLCYNLEKDNSDIEKENSNYHTRILYSGLIKNMDNWFSTPNYHEFFEIMYFYKGSGSVFIDNVEHAVKAGDIVIYYPGVRHTEKSSKSNPFQFVFTAFEIDSLSSFNDSPIFSKTNKPVISSVEYRFKLETIFFQLVSELKNHVYGYELICESLLISLIINMQRIEIASNVDDCVMSECQRVKEFIDCNYTKNLTLDTLSEIIYVSKHHFAHIFKHEIGIAPIKYLIQKRIDEAKDLLINTDMIISDIGKAIGYDNPNYFSQLFKKIVGESPLNYRQKMQRRDCC